MLNKTVKALTVGLLAGGLMLLSQQAMALPSHQTSVWQSIAGISWSTDGGTTWGNGVVYAGDTIEFKLDMYKNLKGNHYLDLGKIWLDFNGDGSYTSPGDASLFVSRVNNSSNPTLTGQDFTNLAVNQTYSLITSAITLTSLDIGNISLLARVTCSESVLQANGLTTQNQWTTSLAQYNQLFTSVESLVQGQAAAYTLTVQARTGGGGGGGGGTVPEPATILLFGTGLIGLTRVIRKKK